MERAIGYIRVSDQRQVDEGGSLNTQAKQVHAYAAASNFDLVRLFTEEGESAKSDARPQLQSMLRYCKDHKGRISVLIVPKIDRLARHAHDYANIKLALARCGVQIHSVGERIEDTPVGRFTESIMASVAQFDNEVRAERSRGGMVEAVQQGRWVWKAPKGYRNIRHNGKGTIEPDPVESSLVQKAFELLASGSFSVEWVRSWLANNGMPLGRTAFYDLIRNRAYVGIIDQFGGPHAAQPPFVPLVSMQMFRAAGAAIQAKAPAEVFQPNNPEFVLRGTIRCRCGAYLTGAWSRGRSNRYPYYRCTSCRRVNYRRETVHDHFGQELSSYQLAPGAAENLKSILKAKWEKRSQCAQKKQSEAEKKIQKLLSLQSAIVMKNVEGIIPDDVAKAQLRDLGSQIENLAAAGNAAQPEKSLADVLAFVEAFLRDLPQAWSSMPFENKKNLLRFMFPNGLMYDPRKGFGTADSPLQEQVKAVVRDPVFALEHLSFEDTNRIEKWLLGLWAVAAGTSDPNEMIPLGAESG